MVGVGEAEVLALLPATRIRVPVGVDIKVVLVLAVTLPVVPVGLTDLVPLLLTLIPWGVLDVTALGVRVLEGEAP